jgi:hypothetical protein
MPDNHIAASSVKFNAVEMRPKLQERFRLVQMKFFGLFVLPANTRLFSFAIVVNRQPDAQQPAETRLQSRVLKSDFGFAFPNGDARIFAAPRQILLRFVFDKPAIGFDGRQGFDVYKYSFHNLPVTILAVLNFAATFGNLAGNFSVVIDKCPSAGKSGNELINFVNKKGGKTKIEKPRLIANV